MIGGSDLARVIEASGDALVVLDDQWRYAYVNGPALALIGKTRDELIGRAVTDIFPKFTSTPFWAVYQRAVREQALLTVEEFFEPLGRWFDVRAIPLGGLLYLHFKDVTAEKQAQSRERAFEERERARLTDIFQQAPAFMAVLRGPTHVFEMVNPPYLQLVGHRYDLIGRPVAEALPEVVEQGFVGLLDRVYQTGEPFVGSDVPISLRRAPDGPLEERSVDFIYQPLRDADGRITGILAHGIDQTERKRAEDALRASEERYRTLVESTDVGFCVIEVLFDQQDRPVDYRFLEANPAFERHTGLVGAVGSTMKGLVPDMDGFWFEVYGRVALTGEPTRFENHAPAMGRWFDVYALRVGAPEQRRVGVLFTDITARKHGEAERERMYDLERSRARQLRQLAEASLVINSTALLSEMFQAICDGAREIVGAHQSVVSITRGEDWSQAINAVSISDRYASWRSYATMPDGSGIYSLVCRENRTLRLTQAELEAHPAWRGFGAHAAEHPPMNGWLAVPLVARDGTNLGLIQLSDRYDGEFNENDEAILVQLAQLASVAIENQRLYQEAQTRAEREAVLAHIGAAIRSSLSPADVQAVAVEALGKALGVDRCYFSTVDIGRDQVVIGRDFCTEGVAPLAGTYRLSEFAVDVGEVFGGGRTLLVGDTQDTSATQWGAATAAVLSAMRVRAMVNVPFHNGRGELVAALGVAMADAPREWSPEEVAFIEEVATETREAVEAVRLQQRERTIAQQLQDALTPPAPPPLPGLSLASHYRPALAEAGVGGDFFDVFAVEKGCTAIVVADLSGKGLTAAQQVATVRNMLRFALYTGRTVAEGVTALHHALVEHDLLAGFATLFVGMYDHAQRTMTYVNCGQEPGLLWRAATGAVEPLSPTGPVLGGFGDGGYAQQTVLLQPGDVIALFTDGLTEVGPSRKELLEIGGVSDLLSGVCAAHARENGDPQKVVDHLIADVEAFGRGVLRDDIALLIGVVGRGEGGGSWE